ncbi:MAG: AccI family restriction endonuclease [Verrucomicrobiota bacterium]
MSSSYFQRLESSIAGVAAKLSAKGVESHRLAFGGQGSKPTKKPRVPTDARSEFLANRAMGDWAERTLAITITNTLPAWKVIQYGDSATVAAGHPGFKARYLLGLEDTRQFGKRPDLLLFPAEFDVDKNLSERGHLETESIVKQAISAIEVRSSKFDALKYIAVRQKQRSDGDKTGRETPSFTVKVEDLVIAYRWMERYCVPQSYFQVFFDSIFAINFLNIFEIIATEAKLLIEKPAKSQEKATIMIPITRGTQVGKATSLPTFAAEHHVTKLGRHDAYVVPQGGGFELDAEAMKKVLLP